MGLFDRFSGAKRRRKSDAEATAQVIVTRYHERRARGEFRVDDKLHLELLQVMPKEVAERIFGEFRTRRAHAHPMAESILLQDIGIALIDAEHVAAAAKPIIREAEPAERATPGATLREIAVQKVLNGQSMTDAEEDAILWSRDG